MVATFYLKVIITLSPLITLCFAYVLNYLSILQILMIYLVYCTYQYFTSNSVLYYQTTDYNNKVMGLCNTLRDNKYRPHFFLPSPLVQILLFDSMAGPPEELNIERESVNNEGTYIDWLTLKNKTKTTETNTLKNERKSILLLLPGLTGCSRDLYIMNTAYEAIMNDYIVVVYYNRLISEDLKLPEDSNVNLIDDLDLAIDKINLKYPNCDIYSAGYSYGANTITHYLGSRNSKNKRIQAAVSVGNAYDLIICQRFLEDTIYDHFILKLLKKNLNKTMNGLVQPHKKIYVDINKAHKAIKVKEFDEYNIRRVLGYKSADEYYRDMSCINHIHKINVPLLCISAKDDYITTAKAIPYDDINLNENIILLVTDKGGHLCYFGNESLIKLRQWVIKPVLEFLNANRNLRK